MIHAFAATDTGPVRKNNEDSCAVEDDLQVYVVADGMGGHSAGEVASRLAVEALVGFMRRSHEDPDVTWPYGLDRELSFHGNRLRTAINLANRRIFRAAEGHDDYTGMGTTIVCALIADKRLVIGHVGDSRLYLLNGTSLKQLTQDDTWAAAVMPGADAALLTQHPMRHVLTNVLGAREKTEAHVSEHELAGGETLLLCSDGLYGALGDDDLLAIMKGMSSPQEVAGRLVQAAIDGGTRDNVTALVVRYEADA
jgi:serine/threonine protein phosphatase PrpC